MLGHLRVIDLSDERGHLASRILADMGAEVIMVEPPGGSHARVVGPFVVGSPGPDSSLVHRSYNRGKSSVAIDLASQAGMDQLQVLITGADIVMTAGRPSEIEGQGLSPDTIAAWNPQAIHVTMTPFGWTGPKAEWASTDTTLLASSGQLSMTGDADRAPVRIGLSQAWLHACADGAMGALIAIHERDRSGLGQHINVSVQTSVMAATQSFILSHGYNSPSATRMAGGVKIGPWELRLLWPCLDGHVSISYFFGAGIGPFTQRLMNWIHEEGMCTEQDRSVDWIGYGVELATGAVPMEHYVRMKDEVVADFIATKTKAQLLEASLTRRVLIAPVTTVEDVANFDQFDDRDYWQDVKHQDGSTVPYPGPFAKFSGTPLRSLPAAPSLGSTEYATVAAPRRPRLNSPSESNDSDLPLSDVKILDLQWVMAGPASSRVLADYGAQVVRVESANRVETARTLQPFVDDEAGVENSGLFQNMNAGKLGLTVDMTKPESRGVILDLVRWSDVVCESFSPKAMRNWNLSYEDLCEVKPDIIMSSSCLFGQTGPLASFAGFGNLAAALSGFYEITGWPDRDPAGPFGAYSDYVSPRFLTAAIVAAVDHHSRTGQGQYIDISQAEATTHFLAPFLLDFHHNGRVANRHGNRHPEHAPHGVYPAAGEDEWVAIGCESNDQWRSLANEMQLADDLRHLTTGERIARSDELEDLLAEWTASHTPLALQDLLQAAGIPAHHVNSSPEAFADVQLTHRGHFVNVEHTEHDGVFVEGSRVAFSRTPASVTHAGPAYGQHTFEVLTDILGYDADRIANLAVAGVLE